MPTDCTAIRPATRRETWTTHPGSRLSVQIGTYTLPETQVFTTTEQVAAWHSKISCEPQTVPVMSNGYYAFVRLEGTVISAYFPAMFGGVAYGSQPQNEKHPSVGSKATFSMTPYLYNAAEQLADPDSRYTPADNIEVVLTGWCEHVYSDERYASAMFGIVLH